MRLRFSSCVSPQLRRKGCWLRLLMSYTAQKERELVKVVDELHSSEGKGVG